MKARRCEELSDAQAVHQHKLIIGRSVPGVIDSETIGHLGILAGKCR